MKSKIYIVGWLLTTVAMAVGAGLLLSTLVWLYIYAQIKALL